MNFSVPLSRKRFASVSWIVLAYNLPVILWGAFVRISFSGDGCGANWPTCSGQFIPQKMPIPMAIEYTHRMMTSLDTLLVLAMLLWAFFAFPKKHAVRRYAVWSLVFLLVEALLGAGLVLFRYVAKDQSVGRVWYLSAHLTNTMLLLAVLTITAWLARTNTPRLRLLTAPKPLLAGLVIIVFVSITGTITALGDTLFPSSSLSAGVQQDFTATSNFLLRLRVVHPLFAVAAAAYIIWIAAARLRSYSSRAATAVIVIVVVQIVAGMLNLALLAPVGMQLVHLIIADLVWIAVLLLTVECIRRRDPLDNIPHQNAEPAARYAE
jgi:heme A synthase